MVAFPTEGWPVGYPCEYPALDPIVKFGIYASCVWARAACAFCTSAWATFTALELRWARSTTVPSETWAWSPGMADSVQARRMAGRINCGQAVRGLGENIEFIEFVRALPAGLLQLDDLLPLQIGNPEPACIHAPRPRLRFVPSRRLEGRQ